MTDYVSTFFSRHLPKRVGRVVEAVRHSTDHVEAYDAMGQIIPELTGPYSQVVESVLEEAEEGAKFYRYSWRAPIHKMFREVERGKW